MSCYGRNAHYWEGKEKRAQKAARHTELMEESTIAVPQEEREKANADTFQAVCS